MSKIKLNKNIRYCIDFKPVDFKEGESYEIGKEIPLYVAESILENKYGEQIDVEQQVQKEPVKDEPVKDEVDLSDAEIIDVFSMKKVELQAVAEKFGFDVEGLKVAEMQEKLSEDIKKMLEENKEGE